jgi:hypothetical protein
MERNKAKITVEVDLEWNEDGTWENHTVTIDGPALDKKELYHFLECDSHFFELDDKLYMHMAKMED